MKTIVNILIVVFVFLALRDYFRTQKRNSRVSYTEQPVEVAYDNNQTNDGEIQSEDNQIVFHIAGIEDVSESDLKYTKQIIENFYGYKCIIDGNVPEPSDVCFDGVIDAMNCVNKLDGNSKTLYLTNKLLEDDGVNLRGFTTINGNTIIVRANRGFMKSTIIHEIGHTLGLEHCSDLTCVMAISNDEQDSGDFCENCKRIINR